VRTTVAIEPQVETYFYHRLSNLRLLDGYVSARLAALTLRSGDKLTLGFEPQLHVLEAAAAIVPGATGAPGEYAALRPSAKLRSDESRAYGASFRIEHGGWYDGALTTIAATAELRPSPHLAARAGYQLDRIRDLGAERHAENLHLFNGELRLAASPRLQLVGFAQRSTLERLTAINARLMWEVRPLSFLYLVYDDVRLPDDGGELRRTWRLTAKLTWLVQP